MTAEDGFVEIGTISLPEMMEFLERQSDDVVITGAGQLPSGLWFAFLRIYGSTVILNEQCSEEQAARIVRAATVFTDLLDTVIVEQGGEVTNELPLAKEIFDIAQWPDSTS
jgi:hypothetical protein